MIIQGCHVKVTIKKSPLKNNFLCIEIGRRKKIADIKLFREVYVSDAQIETIKSLSPDSIFVFQTDAEGLYAEISTLSCYNEFPRLKLPGITEIIVPSLDGLTNANNTLSYNFVLKNSFELENSIKVLNLFLLKKCYIYMSVNDEKSLTISVTDNHEYTRPFLSIRMDLWIPNKNSKAFKSWKRNQNGKQASLFNSLLATKKGIVGKFYLSSLSKPSLEFRAVL